MQYVSPDQATLGEAIARLQLRIADEKTAYGEVDGCLVTMTLLGMEPLSILLGYNLREGTTALPSLAPELQEGLDAFRGTLTLQGGCAWLSLYGLSEAGGDGIEAIVRLVAHALKGAGVAFESLCSKCGETSEIEVVHIGGQTTRLCPACLENLDIAREEEERQLNRGSVLYGAGLPIIFALTAIGWMAFWVIVDSIIERRGIRVIVIDPYTGMILVCLLGAVGYGLGTFLGSSLRRSGITRLSPTAVAGGGVILATIAGELLYVAVCIFRQIGAFDLGMAWAVFVPFVQTYPRFWIVGKLIVIGLATFGAMKAAAPKKAALRL